MEYLPCENLKVEKKSLHTPALSQIKDVFSTALLENFDEGSVEIVDCPDLTKEPFKLAASGIGGNPVLLEVGGPPFLLPSVKRDKVYDIKDILKSINYNEDGGFGFVVGAGAGPWPQLSRNCEMMMNAVVPSNSEVINETRLAFVDKKDECVLQKSLKSDTRFALLANLLVSKGSQGKVLKVEAKKRKGQLDFIGTLQQALQSNFKDSLVGLGGTFLMKEGKAKQHVMPDFSNVPLKSEKQLNNWLHFYDMSAPLVALGTFVSSETSNLDLRVQHFHSFNHQSHQGGHYHIDTTPDVVHYLGYFTLANSLYRIDQPEHQLTFGKD